MVNFVAKLVIVDRMMHFCQVLLDVDQVVWRRFAPLGLPGSLQHIVELFLLLGVQVAERGECVGQQFEVLVRDDAVVVHVEQAVQCAHLAAPEVTVSLRMTNRIL